MPVRGELVDADSFAPRPAGLRTVLLALCLAAPLVSSFNAQASPRAAATRRWLVALGVGRIRTYFVGSPRTLAALLPSGWEATLVPRVGYELVNVGGVFRVVADWSTRIRLAREIRRGVRVNTSLTLNVLLGWTFIGHSRGLPKPTRHRGRNHQSELAAKLRRRRAVAP